MPGPIDIDPGQINTLTEIATKNEAGQWVAGPDAPGYEQGQYIPTKKVKVTEPDGSTYTKETPGGNVGRSYTNRQRTNLVKANMRRQDMTEKEAREFVNEKIQEIEDKKREGADPDEIVDIQRSLRGS